MPSLQSSVPEWATHNACTWFDDTMFRVRKPCLLARRSIYRGGGELVLGWEQMRRILRIWIFECLSRGKNDLVQEIKWLILLHSSLMSLLTLLHTTGQTCHHQLHMVRTWEPNRAWNIQLHTGHKPWHYTFPKPRRSAMHSEVIIVETIVSEIK